MLAAWVTKAVLLLQGRRLTDCRSWPSPCWTCSSCTTWWSSAAAWSTSSTRSCGRRSSRGCTYPPPSHQRPSRSGHSQYTHLLCALCRLWHPLLLVLEVSFLRGSSGRKLDEWRDLPGSYRFRLYPTRLCMRVVRDGLTSSIFKLSEVMFKFVMTKYTLLSQTFLFCT